MATNSYRLGEYKLIEFNMGELKWEAHCGFAALQEGRCFMKGEILFIGPPENDQIGFLKGDFLDHIQAFPVWSKTRYYCNTFDIYHCETGKEVAEQQMLMWMLGRGADEGGRTPKEGTFRLGRYEITRKRTGQIAWKTAPGPNTISQGACTALEDILFIGPAENTEFDSIGRRFAGNLRQLPKWDQTGYYCSKSSLCDCGSRNRVKQPTKTWPSVRRAKGKRYDTGKVGKCIRFRLTGLDTWKRQALIFSNWAI